MLPRLVLPAYQSFVETKEETFILLTRAMRPKRPARDVAGPAVPPGIDPYVLALLATQELAEGRSEQARHLIETVYEMFDAQPEQTYHELQQGD